MPEGGATPALIALAQKSNFTATATNGSIILSNLPQNAKVEVYSLKGEQIHSAVPIPYTPYPIAYVKKGTYIVRVRATGLNESRVVTVK
jgi:hypothetical protein